MKHEKVFFFSRTTGRDVPFYKCLGANKGDISVCFELLWKAPFVWLCLLLSRKPTFPAVLFMLIVLFLPLSSSRFWPQTQSSKCGRPRMFESSLFTSLCLSPSLFRLCIFPSLCLSVSCSTRLSHPGPLLSRVPRGHETAVWQNEITTELFGEVICCEIFGGAWAKFKAQGQVKRKII